MYIYEQAFKESVRLILMIEQQWQRIQELIETELSPKSSEMVLNELIRLLEMLDRSDIKVKLLQELTGAQERAAKLFEEDAISEQDFDEFKHSCESTAKKLAMASRVLSKSLLEDPLLSALFYKQTTIYTSFYCDTWRWQSEEEKKLQVSYWMDKLSSVYHAVRLIMWIVRASGQFRSVNIVSGFYRDSMIGRDVLDVSLIRINCESPKVHPTVSIAKHWVALTLYASQWDDGVFRAVSQKEDMTVGLAICS